MYTLKRYCLLWLIVIFPHISIASPTPPPYHQQTLEVFVRDGCPHCAAAKQFLAEIAPQHPEIHIIYRPLNDNPDALKALEQHFQQHKQWPPGVPTFIINGKMQVGFDDAGHSGVELLKLLHDEAPTPKSVALPFIGTVNLERLGLPLFTLTMGLLDGLNPCSMWVLVLVISLLAPMNDRWRMLIIAGTFVAVEGIVYFLFMTAWLNVFLFIGLSRAAQWTVALLALFAGGIHLKDFWFFGRGVSLSVPASAKPGIYAQIRRVLQAKNLPAALAGMVILALLVQIVEFMCTSGFPALYTQILTQQQLPATAYYAYLLLYNLAYMFDDIVVLAIGVITLSQHRLQEKEGRWLKLISGLVMVLLAIVMVLRPNWLV